MLSVSVCVPVCALCSLLDSALIDRCLQCCWWYAEVLHRWELFEQRAELLHCVSATSTEVTNDRLGKGTGRSGTRLTAFPTFLTSAAYCEECIFEAVAVFPCPRCFFKLTHADVPCCPCSSMYACTNTHVRLHKHTCAPPRAQMQPCVLWSYRWTCVRVHVLFGKPVPHNPARNRWEQKYMGLFACTMYHFL